MKLWTDAHVFKRGEFAVRNIFWNPSSCWWFWAVCSLLRRFHISICRPWSTVWATSAKWTVAWCERERPYSKQMYKQLSSLSSRWAVKFDDISVKIPGPGSRRCRKKSPACVVEVLGASFVCQGSSLEALDAAKVGVDTRNPKSLQIANSMGESKI